MSNRITNRISSPTAGVRTKSLLQTLALTVGAVFLLVGVLGFVPGVTTHYGQMELAGHESGAKLLDVFQVSVLHNVVHLLFGVAGIAMSRRVDSAFLFLVGGGAIYLVLSIYGLAVGQTHDANFVPVNNADDWLHFALGAGMIALGFLGRNGRRSRFGL